MLVSTPFEHWPIFEITHFLKTGGFELPNDDQAFGPIKPVGFD